MKNKAGLADSHAHLDFNNFERDRPEVIRRAASSGVQLIINVGFDLNSSRRSLDLAEEYPSVYASVGIHPHDAGKAPQGYLEELERLAAHPKAVAVGETGLDYYRDRSPRKTQQKVFREQLELALRLNMPVIIHDRDAHEDVLHILKEAGVPSAGGVMHCFSGNWKLAQQALEMGLYISIAGPVTYPKNAALGEVASRVPEDRLLVETDAPFLTPNPRRGKRNEPAFVSLVAERVASLRGVTPERVGKACLENTTRLFSINENSQS